MPAHSRDLLIDMGDISDACPSAHSRELQIKTTWQKKICSTTEKHSMIMDASFQNVLNFFLIKWFNRPLQEQSL